MNTRAQTWIIAIVAGLAGGYALASDPMASSPADRTGAVREPARDDGPPSVSIARRVVDAAGTFERYVRSASAVNPDFDGATSVSNALMIGAAYDSHQLEEGAVGYAALVALQQPAFVGALAKTPGDAAERSAYLQHLVATPDLVLEVPGAPQAAAMASLALSDMGSGLVGRGQAVAQAAYSVQHQPWALEPVAEPAARLAQVEAAGQHPARLTDSETNQLLAKVVARRQGVEDVVGASAPSQTVLRGLVLAAAAMLGQAGETRAEALSPLLSEPDNTACLRRAKLNLHQCLAASSTVYEDVFCAGQHAMAETGRCIVEAAGRGAEPEGVRVPVAAAAYAQNASAVVSVPIARKPLEPAGVAAAKADLDPPAAPRPQPVSARRPTAQPPSEAAEVVRPADGGDGP